MQLKFFTIPVLLVENEEDIVNKFLRSVRVLEIKRELICLKENAYWAISVLFLPHNNEPALIVPKGKVDYKDLLSDEQFSKFCEFRKVRKRIADEEALPAFAIFTDYELAEISKLEEISVQNLKQIKGIGNKKIEKFGNRFCELISSSSENEESR